MQKFDRILYILRNLVVDFLELINTYKSSRNPSASIFIEQNVVDKLNCNHSKPLGLADSVKAASFILIPGNTLNTICKINTE
jgi:hypothetical protein